MQQIKDNFHIDPHAFLKLSDEEIKKRFKNHDFVISIRQKIEEKSDEDKTMAILKNYQKCPKCKILVDKYDGYTRDV